MISLFSGRNGKLLKEATVFILAAGSSKLFAILLLPVASYLLLTRFWLDQEMITRLAWLVDTILVIAVLEFLRTRSPKVQMLRFKLSDCGTWLILISVLLSVAAISSAKLAGQTVGTLEFRAVSESSFAAIIGLLIGAIQEELFFRYFLYISIARISSSRIFSLFMVSLMFASIHLGKNFWTVFSLGLLFGAVAVSTRSVWPAAMCHFMTNLMITTIYDRSIFAEAPIINNIGFAEFEFVLAILMSIVSVSIILPVIRRDTWFRFGMRFGSKAHFR